MGKRIVLTILVFGLAHLSWADDPAEARTTADPPREVRLVDGTVLIVTNTREVGRQFIFTLHNGAMVAFQREDVDLSTLPNGLGADQASFVEASGRAISTARAQASDQLGARKLNKGEGGQPGTGIVVQITGDGSAVEPGDGGYYEKSRQQALAQLEVLSELHAERAAELTKNMREYVSGCYGTTTTYHDKKTSGAGLTTGTVDTEYQGAWVGGNTNGVGNWGVYAGSSLSQFEGYTIWTQEEHTTSTTHNSETPHCRGLWAEIKSTYNVIGPTFTNAIQQARLSYVLDSETNAVLTKYGIGTVDIWMAR